MGSVAGGDGVIRSDVGGVPMKVPYRVLRTIHLLCGVFSLPALLMYGVSAVRMAHSKWFANKPAVTESDFQITPGHADGRLVAREVMAQSPAVRGEINNVQPTATGFSARVVVPGTVHEIRYDRASGGIHLRTSVAGPAGMLNRLHHAAGLWHEYGPLQVWAALVAVVSLATLTLGATGIWMWWLRRQDRIAGMILIGANLAFAVVILSLLRASGP